VELEPNYGLTYWYLGLVYEQKGMYVEALKEMGSAKDFLKSNLTVDADMGRVYALSGRRSEADRAIARLKKESSRRYVNPYQIGLIYVGLGQNDQAFEWLDKAVGERSDMLVYLKTDSRLNPIRSDSRFPEIEQRVGIPP